MDQTKASSQQVPPLLRTEAAKNKKSKDELLMAINRQLQTVVNLAGLYARTGDQETRKQLNLENMHLHGQIHVFWDAMKTESTSKKLSHEQDLLSRMQSHANQQIEAAAKIRGHGVTYVHLNDIKSSSGQTAGQHIYEKLVHQDNDTHDKFHDAVEDGIKAELLNKGLDKTFFERLHKMVNPSGATSGTETAGNSTAQPGATAAEPKVADDIPLRGAEQTVNPFAEALATADRRITELIEELKQANQAKDANIERVIEVLREKEAAVQRELETQKALTRKAEETNASLLKIMKLESQLAWTKKNRDQTFDLYESLLEAEQLKLAQEREKYGLLDATLFARELEIQRLLKKLARAKKIIKTKEEIQNIYDGKVYELQKSYSESEKRNTVTNKALAKTKGQLATANQELASLRK
jgi:chromosome segregation ATPase